MIYNMNNVITLLLEKTLGILSLRLESWARVHLCDVVWSMVWRDLEILSNTDRLYQPVYKQPRALLTHFVFFIFILIIERWDI